MVDNDVIGIANDRACNIRDYAGFDPNAMSTGITRNHCNQVGIQTYDVSDVVNNWSIRRAS